METFISIFEFLAVAYAWFLIGIAILVVPNMLIKELYPEIKSFIDTCSKL